MELAKVQEIICSIGKIDEIGPDEILGNAGFSSMNALELLLEIETLCEISVPDDRFIAARTPRDLFCLIRELREEQAV